MRAILTPSFFWNCKQAIAPSEEALPAKKAGRMQRMFSQYSFWSTSARESHYLSITYMDNEC